MPLLPVLLCLAAAAPLAPDDSALTLESRQRAEGQAHLARLRAHLVPPRHRAGATVHVRELRPFHAPRPDMVRPLERTETMRAFETRFGWQFEVAVTEGAPGASEESRLIRHRGARVDGLGGGLDAGQQLTTCLLARAAFPKTLVDFVADHGIVTGFTDLGEGRAEVLLDLPGGRVLLATVRGQSGRAELAPSIAGVDWLVHDDLLGDATRRLRYREEAPAAPGVVSGYEVVGPRTARLEASVVATVDDTGAERDPRPADWQGASDPAIQEAEMRLESRWLADDLLEVLIPAYDSRVLALELETGWAVLEAPVASRVGRMVLDVLAAERPGLPVRWVLASHHHPHYVGALRPFVAAGARVVVPEGVAGYVEELLHRPRTLRPDRLSAADVEPEVIGVPWGERWSPPGAEEQLVVLEAAGRSGHTEDFAVFVLPEARLGFGGDLLWVPTDTSGLPTRSTRTVGLARILEDAPAVEQFLTSWPVALPGEAEPKWRDHATLAELRRAAGLR